MLRAAALCLAVALVACKKDPAPPTGTDAAAAAAASGVSQQDVKRIIREARPAMEKCSDAAIAANPNFTGKVTLVFSVNGDGAVDTKRLGLGGEPASDAFAKCVLDIVAGLKFPPSAAATDIQMPLDLGKHADAGVAAVPDARAD